MKLIVDADATPRRVLEICKQMTRDAGLDMITVSSYNHNVISSQHITVGGDPEETDIKIANLTRAGDIVVTQDWGLAALLLGRGAAVISPGGHIYRAETIDFLLEERNIKARYRRAGGRTKGPAKRTDRDDRRFTAGLKQLMQPSP